MEIYLDRASDAQKNTEKISGTVIYMDTKFTFSVHKAFKDAYPYVVKESVISSETGKILQVGGKKRRDFEKKLSDKLDKLKKELAEVEDGSRKDEILKKVTVIQSKMAALRNGSRLESLNACAETYIRDNKESTINNAVTSLTLRLYGEHRDDIIRALTNSSEANGADLHARTAYDFYQNDYFGLRRKRASKNYLRTLKGYLKQVCNGLNEKPLGSITVTDVKKLVQALKGDVDKKLNLAEDFFTYCGECGAYSGDNPISRYKQHKQKVKSPERDSSGKDYPQLATFLMPEVDARLHANIENSLEDDMSLVIPLIKGRYMSVDRVLSITWEDVIFINETVLIKEIEERYTGGTNNYTRAPTHETAEFIKSKYLMLTKKYGKRELKKMNVVPFPEGTTEKKKKAEVTKYIKRMLKEAGVGDADFTKILAVDKSKEAGGVGSKLLKSHYEYTLRECGIDLLSGIGHFMTGRRIYDTTTDSYRGLTEETGVNHIDTIMRRSAFFDGNEQGDKKITSHLYAEEGCREIVVPATGNSDKTGVVTKRRVLLPAGSTITVCSKYGIDGVLSFSNLNLEEESGPNRKAGYIDLY